MSLFVVLDKYVGIPNFFRNGFFCRGRLVFVLVGIIIAVLSTYRSIRRIVYKCSSDIVETSLMGTWESVIETSPISTWESLIDKSNGNCFSIQISKHRDKTSQQTYADPWVKCPKRPLQVLTKKCKGLYLLYKYSEWTYMPIRVFEMDFQDKRQFTNIRITINCDAHLTLSF